METRSPVAQLEMMYSPGHNSASTCTRALASARLCASSFFHEMQCSIGSQPEDGKGQTHLNSAWGRLRGIVERLSHQFGITIASRVMLVTKCASSLLGWVAGIGPPLGHLQMSFRPRRCTSGT